jgi:hypothetical protein
MKLAVLVLLALAACQQGAGSGDDYPVGTGGGGPVVIGGGGGGSGVGDAGTGVGDAGTGDAGTALRGRVCLLTDLRRVGDSTACAGTGANGLVVSLGTRTATTAADGSFTIVAPLGGGLTWHVTGSRIITSVMLFGADPTIPAISDVVYGDLLNTNQVTLADQQGSIVVRVVSGVTPVVGTTATSIPASNRLALYDGNNATVWTENRTGTGPRGIAWFTDVPLAAIGATLATVTLTPRGLGPVPAVPVENQAITFVTQDTQ